MQKSEYDLIREQLYDARSENVRLYETIDQLQRQIEKLKYSRKSGEILVNVKELIGDLNFMLYAGELMVKFVFHDGLYVKLDAADPPPAEEHNSDVW